VGPETLCDEVALTSLVYNPGLAIVALDVPEAEAAAL